MRLRTWPKSDSPWCLILNAAWQCPLHWIPSTSLFPKRYRVESVKAFKTAFIRQRSSSGMPPTPCVFFAIQTNRPGPSRPRVDAIIKCLDDASVHAGHGLLVLPENAQPYLHNCIKRRLRNRLSLQCASASRIERFYELSPKGGRAEYIVRRDQDRRYSSYLRNLAMGLVLVNGQIPWVLHEEKHYDAYIGLDVLHNTAAGCFLYERGTKCVVRTWESRQSEKVRYTAFLLGWAM